MGRFGKINSCKNELENTHNISNLENIRVIDYLVPIQDRKVHLNLIFSFYLKLNNCLNAVPNLVSIYLLLLNFMIVSGNGY